MRSILIAIFSFFPLAGAIADVEPNNTWQEATALPQDTTVAGTQSDDDWYVINAAAGARILIDLTFTHAENNIRMRFYDDSRVAETPPATVPGVAIRTANTTTDHEFIDIDVSATGAGAYYIFVDGQNSGNEYTLTWTELPVAPADDGFEPNNDGANAKAVAAGMVAFGSHADEDWYSIDVTAGNERVLVSLRFSTSGGVLPGKLDLALYDAGGNLIASSTNPDGENESLDVDLTTASTGAGTYLLQVTGDTGDAVADGYAMNWAGVTVSDPAVFPVPEETMTTTTTTTPTSSGSSGAFSPAWLLMLMLAGLLRRKYR